MKLLIARLNHETNTFSPVPTPLSAFGTEGPTYGPEADQEQRGRRTAMSAFLDVAEAAGADVVTPVSASAHPSGPVDRSAYESLTACIIDAAQGCDGILLDLHGAMVVEGGIDGEGRLLALLRLKAPDTPIAVALDLHANLTAAMVDNADIIVGFKTYPHVDMYETGERAGLLLMSKLAGRSLPCMAWRQLPLMSHTLCSATGGGAMQRAVETARHLEETHEALAVSVFAGFALSDIPSPCMSVVVIDANSTSRAQLTADRLARQIWHDRAGFIYRGPPLKQAIADAQELAVHASRPVLLLDHGDNCMSGGTCDTMDVLEAARAHGLDGIGVGPLCDPQAVRLLVEAGTGAWVSIPLGNKAALTHIGRHQAPMQIEGVVRSISDGNYTVRGPTYTGQRFCMGTTVLLDAGFARLIIAERTHEPWDMGVFECVGLDPARERFLLLKSRMYCRPVFEPIAAACVECDSRGVTSSDYALFTYTRIKRPVYPLDPLTGAFGP